MTLASEIPFSFRCQKSAGIPCSLQCQKGHLCCHNLCLTGSQEVLNKLVVQADVRCYVLVCTETCPLCQLEPCLSALQIKEGIDTQYRHICVWWLNDYSIMFTCSMLGIENHLHISLFMVRVQFVYLLNLIIWQFSTSHKIHEASWEQGGYVLWKIFWANMAPPFTKEISEVCFVFVICHEFWPLIWNRYVFTRNVYFQWSWWILSQLSLVFDGFLIICLVKVTKYLSVRDPKVSDPKGLTDWSTDMASIITVVSVVGSW